jgi:DnaJ-class molecular chaperone
MSEDQESTAKNTGLDAWSAAAQAAAQAMMRAARFACTDCGGKGRVPLGEGITWRCPSCGGSGNIAHQRRFPRGRKV